MQEGESDMEDQVIINCDWLQYSVILEENFPELICPDGYRIEIFPGNNIFKHRAIVSDEQGRKWLTLLWCPHSSLLNKRLMTVQVANQLLYYSAIQLSFNVLQQIVNCRFNSCGRLDVCADFQVDDEKIQALKHLNSGHYYIQGKSEGSTWWHVGNKNKDDRVYKQSQLHCLSWGSKNSDVKVKCYHKSREQGMLAKDPKPEKPYIIEQWRDAGWDVTKVWRLEFSISGTGRYKWKGESIDLDKVKSYEWLRHLYYSLYNSRFVMRENQGKRQGHKNTDRVIDFLALPDEKTIIERSLGTMDNAKASESVKLLRKLMSQLSSPAVMSSVETCEALCNAIFSIVEIHHLRSYFSGHFGDDVQPYLEKVIANAGPGCYEVDPNPNKLWN